MSSRTVSAVRGAPFLTAVLLAAAAASANVTVNPGHLAGKFHFNADFVPDAVVIEAANDPAEGTIYTASVAATPCGQAGTVSDWCYDLTVEAQNAHNYYLRAQITKNGPPFEFAPSTEDGPTAAVLNATVAHDFSYQPAVVQGALGLSDLNGQPLSLSRFYLNATDNSPNAKLPAQCVGSVATCHSASHVDTSGAASQSAYELYLRPGALPYLLGSQFLAYPEAGGATGGLDFNYLEPYTGPTNPGDIATRDYLLHQTASVGGNISFGGVPIYGVMASAQGTTKANMSFQSTYQTPALNGVASASYSLRLFDIATYPAQVSVRPTIFFSADQSNQLTTGYQSLTVNSGDQLSFDLTGAPSTLQGKVTFNPAYKVSNIYPGLQVVTQNGGNASGHLAPDAVNGGSYNLIVNADNWDYWRFGLAFDLGDPNFASWYQVGNFLPLANANITAQGQTITNDFNFDTALLKVYFTGPNGTTLSDPQLDATLNDAPKQLYETAQAQGLNQKNVHTGEARIVLRVNTPAAQFSIRPSALISGNTSRTDFSPFVVTPQPGQQIVVGTAGSLILQVSSPQEGQTFTSQTCTIPIIGTVTGAVVTGVSVNGTSINYASTNNPTDSQEVGFNYGYPGVPGVNTITITATDNNGGSISDTLHATCVQPNHPPVLTCAPATLACASTAGAAGAITVGVSDQDNDPVQVTWTVDGNIVRTATVAPGAGSDTYSGQFSPYGHTVTISASDGKGGTASCTTAVNVPNPTTQVSLTKPQLWPADHTMKVPGFQANTHDRCAHIVSRSTTVYSNEADVASGNDGFYSPDAKVVNIFQVRLRAERTQPGPGRVYLVVHSVTDVNGHTATDCGSANVPVDLTPANVQAINALSAAAALSCQANFGVPPAGYVQVGTGPVLGPYQ